MRVPATSRECRECGEPFPPGPSPFCSEDCEADHAARQPPDDAPSDRRFGLHQVEEAVEYALTFPAVRKLGRCCIVAHGGRLLVRLPVTAGEPVAMDPASVVRVVTV